MSLLSYLKTNEMKDELLPPTLTDFFLYKNCFIDYLKYIQGMVNEQLF